MKEVIIKSKIVGKEGAIGSGKPIAFPDLSAYALRSDFIRLESSFNDFLNGDDTDNVINRWKELEAFLNNISEDYNLLSLLNGKADKATTLRGYGITDAYTKTNVDDLLKAYVTLSGSQTITGEKNFSGGLKVNGSPIYYDTEKKYWKFEGNLLVTGGVTMYGNEGTYTPSTIMDAILYDSATLGINSNGQLYVKGGTSGGGLDITALQNYLTQNSYLNVTEGDGRYLKLSGGRITGENDQVPLAISNTASTLRIGFVRNNEVLGYFGFIEANKPLFYDTDGNGRLLLHERNYSSYALPLSGGRIVGKLQIQRTPSNIAFYNADNVLWGHIGFNAADNAVVWDRSGANEYEILHRGNYSNYALPLSGGTISGDLLVANSYGGIVFANTSNNSNAFLFYNGDSDWYVTNKDWGTSYKIWHSGIFEPFNYLPKSGGTLTGDLKFQENWGGMSSILRESLFPAHIYRLVWSTNGDVYDHYYNNNYSSSTYTSANLRVKANDEYLTLRFCGDGTFTWNGNKVWHEGNDGSDSGLDADLLDGVQSSGYGQYVDNLSINLNDARNGLRGGKLYNATNAYDSIDASYRGFLEYGSSGYRAQFNSSSSNDLYYRWCEANTWKPWRKVAFEDSNVASATKLQTARTIWGQSFDGTGNVSGDISNTSTIEFDTSNGAAAKGYLWTNTRGMHMDMSGLGTEQQGTNLTLTRYGNVGVGTPSPSQKLHVKNGNITSEGGFVQSYRTNNFNSSGAYMRLTSYYPEGNVEWDAIIASDYYGSHLCTTGGFTHGMYFKSGRYGYDNFIFLDSQGNPVARLSTSSGGGNHHFVGNMLVTGGITMYSDQRKKTILRNVELSLKQIAEAPLIEHYYNGDDKRTTHVGSIAQYWASMNDWFCKLDSEGYYTMEIQNAALASAISIARELDRYETKTDKAIKKLKKRICELEEEIERFKSA